MSLPSRGLFDAWSEWATTRSHVPCNFRMTYGFNDTSWDCVTAYTTSARIRRAVDEASLSTTTNSEKFEGGARPNLFTTCTPAVHSTVGSFQGSLLR